MTDRLQTGVRELERVMKAFANARRIAIVAFLKKRTKPATVGEIATHIKLSFKSTSKHLGILRSAGVVEAEQVSLEMHYKLAPLASAAKTVVALL